MSDAIALPRVTPHRGMPPLDLSGPAISHFEFWPQQIFYAPMLLYWLWLTVKHGGFTLPTVANPAFPMGGWIGESKEAVLSCAGPLARQHIAPWVAFARDANIPADASARAALRQMSSAGIALPCVAKPDKGCRGAGVRRIRNENDLACYISAFPDGERIVLQALVDREAEAGVFYIRKPGEARGCIFSLTLKYFPHVYGDGRSTLRELILGDKRAGRLKDLYLSRHRGRGEVVLAPGEPYRLAFAGSHSRGAIFRDGNHLVTDAMTEAFDAVAKDIAGFHFGRFDVRFSSIEVLQAGKGFSILEVNGAGAEATHIWDRRTRLASAYRTLMKQYAALWEIGAQNRRNGFRPARLRDFLKAWRNEVKLWAQYPPTE